MEYLDWDGDPISDDMFLDYTNGKRPDKKPSTRKDEGWTLYHNEARKATTNTDKSSLIDIELVSFDDYHVDHIVSIWDGHKLKIPVEHISHISNLRVITAEENCLKGIKSCWSCLPDDSPLLKYTPQNDERPPLSSPPPF